MRVAILYNRPVLPPEHPEYVSEEWVSTAVADISQRLLSAGCQVCELGIAPDSGSLSGELRACHADVVFNLFEGYADEPESEIAVARELEQMQIPFTGSSSRTLWLALNKHLAKQRLRDAGVPVPEGIVVYARQVPPHSLHWPVIVKPARRDSSEGIDQASVVTCRAALEDRVGSVLKNYGSPVLVEQFLRGREFTVALAEVPTLRALPISEIDYSTMPADRWPLLSYAAKWQPGSMDYEGSDVIKDTPLAESLRSELVNLSMSAYRALDCRDYARVDLRLDDLRPDKAQRPMVLEVNPNPDMSPSACFAKALEIAGFDRTEFVLELVRAAISRSQQVPSESAAP